MKKTSITMLFVALLATQLNAQNNANNDFETFKKQSQQEFHDFKTKTEKEFKDFRDKENAEFAEFMRERWEYYKTTPKIPAPVAPEKHPVGARLHLAPPILAGCAGNDNMDKAQPLSKPRREVGRNVIEINGGEM